MDKQSLNWLAKEWLNRVAVSSRSGYAGRSYVNPDTRKIFSMMDTSKKRIANPGAAIRDDRYKQLIRDNLSDKNYITQLGANRIITEDIPNLRNEYARMFLVKAMKSKGSIDELAVRQFVKENPKMVEQLLVKNDAIPAGLNARDIASRLSRMYPDGMIKGPIEYERGITGYAQRQFDKTKGNKKIIENAPENTMTADDGYTLKGKNTNIVNIIGTKRSDPITFVHEVFESQSNPLIPGMSHYTIPSFGLVGAHAPGVLQKERDIMGKIPRYIDPVQKNIDKIRGYRDITNEYGTIGKKPDATYYTNSPYGGPGLHEFYTLEP